jgi:hypothetical protein
MIIRQKHKNRFSIVPNRIFEGPRISFVAKGLLAYLVSLPPNWEVRHDQLQRRLGIGRKLRERALRELIAAEYVTRDEQQGRDEFNRFTTLHYVVSDTPSGTSSDASLPRRGEPRRKRSTGNNKEDIKTDFTNPFPQSLPAAQGRGKQASQGQYSEFGRRSLAAGKCAVFVGSKPYEAWRRFRGDDGMPGLVDKVILEGRARDVVWMDSLFPPHRGQLRYPEAERDDS